MSIQRALFVCCVYETSLIFKSSTRDFMSEHRISFVLYLFGIFLRRWVYASIVLISGGAMPAKRYSLYAGVSLRYPVMILQVSFKATDTCLARSDWLHTGHAYSPVEKHRAIPVVRMVCGRAPRRVPASFLNKLYLASTFI